MSAKNKRLGIPKPFTGLIKADFPQDKPIFWGKDQDTDINAVTPYVEPTEPTKGILQIPQVIRFIKTKATFISVFRFLEIGYFDQSSFGVMPYRSSDFVTIIEISSAYRANMSSADATSVAEAFTSWFSGPNRWYFGITNTIFGTIAGQTNTLSFWILGPGGPFDRQLIAFTPITGLILQP